MTLTLLFNLKKKKKDIFTIIRKVRKRIKKKKSFQAAEKVSHRQLF